MDKGLVKPINEHVWLIRDDHNDTCYLVVGEKKGAVIDTMSGYLDVKETARKITDLPLTVINTHGHVDHVMGNPYFAGDDVYMHPADLPMVEELLDEPEIREEMEKEGVTMPPFKPVKQGDTLDLGNLTLEIIELAGHTPGGICVLLKEDRMLFTGDSINRHLWMQLDGCLTLKEYGEKLDAIMEVQDRADTILHGHAGDAEPISLLGEMRRGICEIVAGKTEEDTDYQWFGGVSHQHPFAPNSVIVYGDNIQ